MKKKIISNFVCLSHSIKLCMVTGHLFPKLKCKIFRKTIILICGLFSLLNFFFSFIRFILFEMSNFMTTFSNCAWEERYSNCVFLFRTMSIYLLVWLLKTFYFLKNNPLSFQCVQTALINKFVVWIVFSIVNSFCTAIKINA